jgi:transposase
LTEAEQLSSVGVSNVLTEEKKQQVIALGRMGWSLRQIQRRTGVRRETAAGYLKSVGIAVREPGRWGRNGPAEAKPANQVTSDSEGAATADSKAAIEVTSDFGAESTHAAGTPCASACEPWREWIATKVAAGRNAKAIWQELVDEHGFTADYQSVKRFVRKLLGVPARQPCAVIETAPGEEAQVDYGEGPMVRDPNTGKYRRTRLFVLTLGYSRKSVRLLTFQSSARIWAELHEQAFRRLGGATRVVVLDNLREGVLKPDIYDPALNPLYRDMLGHYGSVALPCRVTHADRKGKVESGVGHAQRTPLKGLRFESLAEAQAYLDRWEENWADTRIHGTTKRQVSAMFAEEKPALLALPLEPFRYYQYGERTVHLDGCVEVAASYYSAPPGWIGRSVRVQWDDDRVRLLDPRTGQLLREHLRQQRGRHRIQDEDRSRKTPQSTTQLLARCEAAGANIGALCQALHRRDGEIAIRRILGILSLAKKHGAATVDAACATALELKACEYRFVRRYLERQPTLPLTLRQVDPIIRQLTLYRDLIAERTQEE